MITVAGFNTSIDKLVELDALQPGEVQRAHGVHAFPGGKGLHVAQTIAVLGEPVRLIGLIDARNHAWFRSVLHERGVEFIGIEVSEPIRTCLTLRERGGRITEVLEPGPSIGALTRNDLLDAYRDCITDSELVVLSGSLPPGCGDDLYARLVRIAERSGQRALVDASGAVLREAIAAQPFSVKPNRNEAAALLGIPLDDLVDAGHALRELALAGVHAPLLSLGDKGALVIDEAGAVLHAVVAASCVVNTVGSGDCLLGGFAVALTRGESIESALRLGVACGAANAATTETGYMQRAAVEALLPQVRMARPQEHPRNTQRVPLARDEL